MDISLTPSTSSLIGLVIVSALKKAPMITNNQIDIKTATVTSFVNAALAKAFLLGVTPNANTPR